MRMLISELRDPWQHVRWEAPKALTDVVAPTASAGLLHAIDDEDGDVRPAAGEELIALKKVSVAAVLQAVIRGAGSTAYCTSAHHILRALKQENADAISPVLGALDEPAPAVADPVGPLTELQKIKTDPIS